MKIFILITILLFTIIKCQDTCVSITNCTDLYTMTGNFCYKLINNIDCSTVQSFTPVPNFWGTLYGQNYRISNLNVFLPPDGNSGLFSILQGGAMIQDLTIRDSVFHGLYAGVFSGQLVANANSTNPVQMVNCYSINNTIYSNSSNSFTGGFVAYVNYPLTLTRCTSTNNRITSFTQTPGGSLALTSCAGGFVGYVDSTLIVTVCTSSFNQIISSSNSSDLSSDFSYAGGIVGYNIGFSTYLSECISTNNYIYSYSNQSFIPTTMISFSGGICGLCYGTIVNSISNLNRIKSYLNPLSVGNFTSTVGGISAFVFLENTSIQSSLSNMNLLRSDTLGSTCDCFFLYGTGCISANCTNIPNLLFI